MFGWVRKALEWLKEGVPAARADEAIDTAINGVMKVVFAVFMLVGFGVAGMVLFDAFNISDPSTLPIVGSVFGTFTKALNIGGNAVVMGFVGIILSVIGGVAYVLKKNSNEAVVYR